MKKPVYEWLWRRANRKHFLALLKDGKKIGSARGWELPRCGCCGQLECEIYNRPEELLIPRYTGYSGGKKLGIFHTMVAAKIAVEQDLGVSTKKEKKPKQPQLVR